MEGGSVRNGTVRCAAFVWDVEHLGYRRFLGPEAMEVGGVDQFRDAVWSRRDETCVLRGRGVKRRKGKEKNMRDLSYNTFLLEMSQ